MSDFTRRSPSQVAEDFRRLASKLSIINTDIECLNKKGIR